MIIHLLLGQSSVLDESIQQALHPCESLKYGNVTVYYQGDEPDETEIAEAIENAIDAEGYDRTSPIDMQMIPEWMQTD